MAFQILVADGGHILHFTILTLCVCILTSAVNAQDETWIEVEFSIVEESPPNTKVGNLYDHPDFQRQPLAAGESRQFSFLPQSSQYQQLYTIDTRGVLLTNTVIDRDESCARSMKCDMMLDVGVIGPDRTFQLMKVTVHVTDINDNAPAYTSDTKVLSISETALPGVSFVLPQAWDPDSGAFGVQTYRLTTITDKFSLNISLGAGGTVDMRLVLLARLDREERAAYALEVVATDGGTPALTGTLTVEVSVRDANDNSPEFQQQLYEVEVREDTAVGDVILQVVASDLDDGANAEIIYSLGSPNPSANAGVEIFSIRNATGEIVLQKRLDYETQTVHHLQVTAMDKGPDAIPTHTRVVILVTDVNDHAPSITVNALTETGNAEIPENAEPGVFVAHVSIEDKDSGPSGEVGCVLSSGPFELRKLLRNVYKVIALSSFDTERQDNYVLTLACHDNGNPPMRTSKDIYVDILDQNDHVPVFPQDVYSATLRENTSVGTFVVQVNASDGDSGDNARLTYTLQDDPTRAFRVDPDTGVISTNRILDYENMHNAKFQVVAVDHGEEPQSSTASVVVNIVDVNDEPPLFYLSSYSFSLEENTPAFSEIGAVMATDKDSEPYNDIVYSLSSNDPDSEPFIIDPHLGLISSRRVLDREYKPSYNLVVHAGNPGYPKMTSSVHVTVLITDVNDNAPTIVFPNNTSNTVNVPYGAPAGYIFTKVVASDVDAGANAKLNYAIAKTSAEGLFDIDWSSGAVSISSSDLWTAGELFDVLITVSDQGTPPKTSSIDMVIVVNKSIIYPGRRDLYPGEVDGSAVERSGGVGVGPLNQNQTVLISLGIVTLLLVTILIVAIILVRRRRYKDDDDEPSCADGAHNQNNFLKVQPSAKAGSGDYVDNDTLPESDSQESGVYSEESGEKGLHKEVKFINNISGGILVKGGPQVTAVSAQMKPDSDSGCYSLNVTPTGGSLNIPNAQENTWQRLQQNQHQLQGSQQQYQPLEANHEHGGHTCRPHVDNGGGSAQPKPWSLTERGLETHHQLLAREPHQASPEPSDVDSTSGSSTEVSTTDSGRGASEDGDNGHHEIKDADMSHASSSDMKATTDGHPDGLAPQPHRTSGRRTRTGSRPPTGTPPVQQGVPQRQTTFDPRHHNNNHHHHHHRQQNQLHQHRNVPSSDNYSAPRQNYNYMGHLPPQSHLGGSGNSGAGKPSTHARDPRCLESTKHQSAAVYRPQSVSSTGSSTGSSRRTPPSVPSGKQLVWERFRGSGANAGNMPHPHHHSRTLDSVHETTQDEMSDDDVSTTSGSYVLDLDDVRVHQLPIYPVVQPRRPLVVGERDSFV